MVILTIFIIFYIQKRANRTKTIEHLAAIEDPIISMFNKGELRPIKESSAYHSPEVSETDEESPNQRKVVIKDLEWQSSTVKLINMYFKLFRRKLIC